MFSSICYELPVILLQIKGLEAGIILKVNLVSFYSENDKRLAEESNTGKYQLVERMHEENLKFVENFMRF